MGIDGIKQLPTEQEENSNKLFNQDLDEKEQKKSHQQKLFWSVLILSLVMIFYSVFQASLLLRVKPNTQEVAIVGLMITAPIILILALLRYVYDGKKEDSPQPTLILNVGKELANVLQSVFKKS